MTYPCKYCDKKLPDSLALLIHYSLMQGIDGHPVEPRVLNAAHTLLLCPKRN